MANSIVSGNLAGNNTKEQTLLECFRALGSKWQDFLLETAVLHRENLEELMRETGLDRETAGDSYSEWIGAKALEVLHANNKQMPLQSDDRTMERELLTAFRGLRNSEDRDDFLRIMKRRVKYQKIPEEAE